MRRSTAVVLALCSLVLVSTAAFAGGKAEPQTAAKHVTLSLWIHEGYTDFVGRWGKDPVSQYIMEKTGVNFEIQTGDGSNDDTKLNLMITSNKMPDMLIVPKRTPSSYTLQKEQVVEDIGKLAAEYKAPNLLRLIQETDDINLKYQRFKDGNYWGGKSAPLYVWPDYFVDRYTYEHDRLNVIQERDLWIARDDIYKALGSPNLNNIEDFYSFLVKVRDGNYKDMNGQPIKVLGMQHFGGGLIDVFAATFTGDDSGIFLQPDGSVINNFEKPEYKEAILFLQRLYRDGLLDQEIFTETYQQWLDKMYAGGVGVLNVYYWHVNNANTKMKSAGLQYWPIPSDNAPKGPGVTQVVMNHGWDIGVGFGWRCNFISTSCKDKAAATRFLDFMYSHEGQMLQWYGMPGVHYEPADAWKDSALQSLQSGSLRVKATQALTDWNAEKGTDAAKESGTAYWMFWNIHGYADFAGGGNDSLSDPYTVYAREQVQKLSKYDFKRATFNDCLPLAVADPETKAVADSVSQIKTKWIPQIVMAASRAEASSRYDSMLAEMQTAGLAKLNASYTKMYKEKMVPLLGDLK